MGSVSHSGSDGHILVHPDALMCGVTESRIKHVQAAALGGKASDDLVSYNKSWEIS